MNKQPANSPRTRTRYQILRHKVAHRISQKCPHKRRHEIPQRHIDRPLHPRNRSHKIDGHKQQTQLRKRVNPHRSLSPLQPLCLTQHNPCRCRQYHQLPRTKNPPRQSTIQHRLQRQPRYRPVQTAQKTIRQKTIRHSIRMQHPPTTR